MWRTKTKEMETKIKNVTDSKEHYYIEREDGLSFLLDKSYDVEPKRGYDIIVHTTSGGSFGAIRGIDINGISVFYKTDEDLESERQEWLQNHEREKQEKFKKEKDSMDARFNALPKVFKDRIQQFRDNNPRFRVDYEGYELYCCEQAVLIANTLKTKESVQAFSKIESFDDQKKAVNGLDEGHSGNTFGCSVRLAYLYLDNPENVVKMHGALAPLVGSSEYGG